MVLSSVQNIEIEAYSLNFRSIINILIQIDSFVALHSNLYYALALESANIGCHFECQEIGLLPN